MKHSFLYSFVVLAAAAAAVLIILISKGSLVSSAQIDQAGGVRHFESVEIQNHDSLWTIAERYAADYGLSTKDYVRELKEVNGLSSDKIIAGRKLIVVYWGD